MATSPDDLILRLLSPQSSNGFTLGQQQYAQNQQQQAANNQALQLGQMQIQAAQAQRVQQARTSAAIAKYQSDPSIDNMVQVALADPSRADAYRNLWQMKSDDVANSHIQVLGPIYSALQTAKNANNPDAAQRATQLAIDSLSGLADAEENPTPNARTIGQGGGQPPNPQAASGQGSAQQLRNLVNILKAGGADNINLVLSELQPHLAASGKGPVAEAFAKAMTDAGKSDPYTLNPGELRYDGDNNVVARGGPKVSDPHYEKIDVLDKYGTKIGERVIQVGGGSSDGSDPAPSVQSGSGAPLSIRLNNPGAIRANPDNNWQGQVGTQNGFVQFDTPANGTRAHRILISNQIKSGYDTPAAWAAHYAPASDGNDPAAYAKTVASGLGIGVNDKMTLGMVPKIAALSARVEAGGTPAPGRPTFPSAQSGGNGNVVYDSTAGQTASNFDPATQIKPNDETTVPQDIRSTVKAIATGQMAQPTSFALTKPYWQNVMAAVAAYDPTFDSSTQPTRVAASKAFTGNGKGAQVLASIDRLSYHLNDLYRDSQALTGWNLGPASGLFNSSVQSFQKAALARYSAALPFVAGELQKLTKNGSATEGESKQIMANLAPSQPASARLAAMQQLAELTQGQFKPIREQWASAFPDGRPMPMDISPESNAILDSISSDRGPVAIDPHTGRLAGNASKGPSSAPASVPAQAVTFLKANPNLSRQFDQKYGLGAAARVLGR